MIDFYKENKAFVYSCLFASGCTLYLLADIIKKLTKSRKNRKTIDAKSIDQKLSELCVPTPTKLHPYQKKLAPYASEDNFFPQNFPGIS